MAVVRLVSPLLFGLASVLAPSARAQLPTVPRVNELHKLIRPVVTDSLIGGGYRKGENFVAVDSTSLALLDSARVPAMSAERGRIIRCPNSGAPNNVGPQATLGYWVRIRLEPTADNSGWLLTVYKSCEFVYPGREPSGFYEGGSWEIQKVNGTWRIVRPIDRVIT